MYITDWIKLNRILTIYKQGVPQGDYIPEDCVNLPNNDILLGCRHVFIYEEDDETECLNKSESVTYFKLSEIDFVDVTDSSEYSFLRGE